MHTVIVMGGGFALLLACLLLGYAFGDGLPGLISGAKAFLPLWLVGAGLNLWIGVHQAGYSVAEELPIFLGIFGVPAIVAASVWWKFS